VSEWHVGLTRALYAPAHCRDLFSIARPHKTARCSSFPLEARKRTLKPPHEFRVEPDGAGQDQFGRQASRAAGGEPRSLRGRWGTDTIAGAYAAALFLSLFSPRRHDNELLFVPFLSVLLRADGDTGLTRMCVCVYTGRAKGGKGEGGGEEEEPGGGLGQLSCVLWLQAASCVFSGDVLDGERVTVIALGVFGNRQWQMSNHIQDSSLVYYILAETLDAKH